MKSTKVQTLGGIWRKYWNIIIFGLKNLCINNHVHRALLENTYIERMRKEKDKKGNVQKRLTLLNK